MIEIPLGKAVVAIEASCPSCGKENIIGMKFHEPEESGVAKLLTAIFGAAGIKHYAFIGEKRCAQCGENIVASVNVSNSKRNDLASGGESGE